MQFQRLRLAGFKSFVEPAELRIEPGLTGVVGPNGCGKSNLLEAIRWVMGEGSAKTLRGGAMDDVIFAGTARRPGRDFAEVTLTLDNSDRSAPVAFLESTGAAAGLDGGDTLQVVRRIERGLGSAYRVNGRDVRARDVALLFADAATGAHSPALVSQGRIGAIIAARPAERRILLEEAAGISGLHARRHEAELRLRATEANLLRLDDVIAALDAQVAALKRAAKLAERYRALSDRLRATEAALVVARWLAACDAAAAAQVNAAAAEAAVVTATRDAARLAIAQADAAVALPGLRNAEALTAAEAQALLQVQRGLVTEAAAVARRVTELAATLATVKRDRVREDGLSRDAVMALDRLLSEMAVLDAGVAAARAAIPAALIAVTAVETAAEAGERGLSTAIERQARAAASARAASAALDTATARAARAEAEAARLAAVPADDVAGLEQHCLAGAGAIREAEAMVADAAARITAAEAERRTADAARETANATLLVTRGVVAGQTAERDALVRLLAATTAKSGSLLDRITVASGDELALAAALGDDLAAELGDSSGKAGCFWTLTSGVDPPLPAGCEPLRCDAPPELARRLASIGIVSAGDAPRLAATLLPGQRLVSRNGQLWRWDGFRTAMLDEAGGQGVAAAARLTQRNRLAAVSAELPEAETALTAACIGLASADAAARAASEADRAARSARTTTERSLDTARTTLAAADIARDRAAARRDLANAAITRLRDDAAGFASEAADARAAAAEIIGLPALAEAVTANRAASDAARAGLARARAIHAALVRDAEVAAARRAAVAADRTAWERRAGASTAQLAELDRRTATAADEAASLAQRPAEIAVEQAGFATRSVTAETARRAAAEARAAAESTLVALDREARSVAETLSKAREARARDAADAAHADIRRREVEGACGERFGMSPPVLAAQFGLSGTAPGDGDARTLADLARDFEALTVERDRIGPVNLRADLELAELAATSSTTTAERTELDTAVARLRGSIGALNREGRVRLLAAFAIVDGHFRELFATLFTGGAARLELVEADDPLASGLEIMAQPPGKKLQSLTLLSGGEQALTATALIFALFLTNPAPICVLDEVDAALDDANVERFCDLLDRMAAVTRTRFLIVTHNAVTMSRMHRLYGVTMAEPGVSQLVSVDLGGAEQLLAAE